MTVFENGTEAVICAIAIQKESREKNISLRLGIHEGEVVLKSLCMHNIPEDLREEWNYNKMLG